ncbi:MAG: acyltransferase [Planctomycetes bacterium]|nr:acyltransferase [Planctomycetota bacterium]
MAITPKAIGKYLDIAGPPQGIPALDGLRAIAILLVLLRHCTLYFQGAEPILPVGGWDAASLAINGWAGVDLFFVLSGFLIAASLMKPRDESYRWQIGHYLLKRFLRIAPLYYVWLALVVSGGVWFYDYVPGNVLFRVAYHVLFLQDYLPSDFVVTFWSLGVEEKFYLVAPLIFLPLAATRNTKLGLFGLALLFVIPPVLRALTHASLGETVRYVTYFRELRSPFICSFDGMVAGAMCAYLVMRRTEFPWLNLPWLAPACLVSGTALVLAILMPAPLMSEAISRATASLSTTGLSAGFALILLGCVLRPCVATQALSGRFLRFYAKLSYSLYLTHWVFVLELYRNLEPKMTARGWPLSLQFLAYTAMFIPLCTVFAALMHWAVEKPFLLLKARIK